MIPKAFTSNVLKSLFNEAYFSRGEQYFQKGRVILTDVRQKAKKSQWLITASVESNRPLISYDLRITLTQSGKRFFVEGECDCPMRYNCKHVVATLLTVIEQQNDNLSEEIDFHRIRCTVKSNVNHDQFAPSKRVDAWLLDLETVKKPTIIEPTKERWEVFYEISLSSHSSPCSSLTCKPLLCKLLKSGQRSKVRKKIQFSGYNQYAIPSEDRPLIGRILVEKGLHEVFIDTGTKLVAQTGEALFTDLLKTGRCYWAHSNQNIIEGGLKKVAFRWETSPDGMQTMQHDQGNQVVLFYIDRMWYLDLTCHQVGLVSTNLSPDVAKQLMNAPAIPPEKASKVKQFLKKNVPKDFLPNTYKIVTAPIKPPIPCLKFSEQEVQIKDHNFSYTYKTVKLPTITVSFRYGTAQISWEDRRDKLTILVQNTLVQHPRDFVTEEAALRYLTKTHHLRLAALDPKRNIPLDTPSATVFFLKQEQDPVHFTFEVLPELRRMGWQVEIDSNCPWDIMDLSMDDWYVNLEENDGMDWFGLELGISLPSGEKINLLPILQKYLSDVSNNTEKTQKMIATLEDGRKIALPLERVQNAANALIDIFNQTTHPVDQLRLSRLQAMRLAQLQDVLKAITLRWHGAEKILNLAAKLSQLDSIQKVELPGFFQGQLRDYQQKGLNWLQFLRENQFSGILSDDMGLGKTIQTIAHISVEKHTGRLQKPVLVIAPTSLMLNWQSELQRFASDLRVLLLHGAQRKQLHPKISKYDVVLTTYPLLIRDKSILLKHDFHLLILDEAQAIKNCHSQVAQTVIQLHAKHRLCLTGTPMENHLGELWSLFHFMMPGFLGTEKQFKILFRTPIEKEQNENRRKHLARIVSPFLLRRKKADVATELPDKTEIVQPIELYAEQRDLYETIRLSMQKKLLEAIKQMGLARSRIMILDALLKLRQICCDPRLLKKQNKANKLPSAKLEFLMSMLPGLVEEGRKILLFSQFTEMLGLIQNALDDAQIAYVMLTGKTRDRKKPIEAFQSGQVPVFLISLKAGGVGLNLTAADTVIHYDPWWNPAVENQATDRAHRIGQEKKVFVYRLVTQGTVEEKMIELQKRKYELAESLLSKEGKNSQAFSVQDLQILLG